MITIYELLGLIKDGKAPKKIIYEDKVYEYCERMDERFNYKNIETNEYFSDEWFIENILNNIVEIIEEVEDKEYEEIEEIEIYELEDRTELEFKQKINALIRNQKKIIGRLDK